MESDFFRSEYGTILEQRSEFERENWMHDDRNRCGPSSDLRLQMNPERWKGSSGYKRHCKPQLLQMAADSPHNIYEAVICLKFARRGDLYQQHALHTTFCDTDHHNATDKESRDSGAPVIAS